MSTTGPTSNGGADSPPIPDYDELSLGELEHRVRPLELGGLKRTMRYELDHAARAPVLQLLTARMAQLETGSKPSPGGEARPRPKPGPPPGRSAAVRPATAGQPVHPPPHGTSDQPGKPKGDRRP